MTVDTLAPVEQEEQAERPKISSRAAVRALFAEATDTLDEINLPEVADAVTEQVKANPELLAAFLEEHLRPMVYEVGFALLASQRASTSRLVAAQQAVRAATSPPSPNGHAPLRRSLLRAPRKEGARFSWLRQPIMLAVGRHIRLEKAKKHELGLAIAAGKQRLDPVRQRVTYWALVREALPDDDKTVGDVLDDETLSALWRTAKERIEREDTVARMAEQKLAEKRAKSAPTT